MYCAEHCPNEVVDAILTSIEHVVLVHIIPGIEIQYTGILPLFDIESHLTMDVRDRYASSYLEKLTSKEEAFMKKENKKIRRARDEILLKSAGIRFDRGEESDWKRKRKKRWSPRYTPRRLEPKTTHSRLSTRLSTSSTPLPVAACHPQNPARAVCRLSSTRLFSCMSPTRKPETIV